MSKDEILDSMGYKHNDCYVLYTDNLWLDFYDGDRYLFSTPTVNASQSSVTFSYDISGVKYLTMYPMQDRNDSFSENPWLIADPIMIYR